MISKDIDELRLRAGISRLEDNYTLIALNKDGSIKDPLSALQEFADLVIEYHEKNLK
jgi:hypothetical protein